MSELKAMENENEFGTKEGSEAMLRGTTENGEESGTNYREWK